MSEREASSRLVLHALFSAAQEKDARPKLDKGDAIESIRRGKRYISPKLSGDLIDAWAGTSRKPGGAAAGPPERIQQLARGRHGVHRRATREREVGSQQGLGLLRHRDGEVLGEGVHRHQRCDTGGHGGGEQQQPTASGAQLALRQAPDEAGAGHAARPSSAPTGSTCTTGCSGSGSRTARR